MPHELSRAAQVRAMSRRVGQRLTTSARVLPDFLVIGAQKAGTTSLGHFLGIHPDIFWSPRAEMHFFDRDYDRGLGWYRSWFERRSVLEAHERRTGRPARVGEKTPAYLVIPDGPTRVHKAMPDVRLVVSVRDPVRRAYSQWGMNKRMNREPLPFLDALAAEPERVASVDASRSVSGTSYLDHGYALRSRYAEHLERWLAVFDRSQLLVYRCEDLYADPATWTTRIFDHIGVDPSAVSDLALPHLGLGDREPLDAATYEQVAERFRAADAQLQDLVGLSYLQGVT